MKETGHFSIMTRTACIGEQWDFLVIQMASKPNACTEVQQMNLLVLNSHITTQCSVHLCCRVYCPNCTLHTAANHVITVDNDVSSRLSSETT